MGTNLEKISKKSWWFDWLKNTRGRRNLTDSDCFQPRSGTFGRHPAANQDPFFYAHHGFTFAIVDLVLQIENYTKKNAPFYDLKNISKYECPGNKFNDVTL